MSDAPTPATPSTQAMPHSSFYASVLTEADRPLLDQARGVEGLTEEIALLRLRLRETLGAHIEDAKLIEGGVRLLIQSLLAQHRLSPHEADNLSGAMANVVEEFGDLMRGMTDV